MRHGLEEPVVDAHAVEEQAFDGPFLEIEDEAHHLRLDARVHVHHLGDDPFLVGRAEGDDNEDLVVTVLSAICTLIWYLMSFAIIIMYLDAL